MVAGRKPHRLAGGLRGAEEISGTGRDLHQAIWFCQPMFWALVSPEMKHLKSTANSTGNAVRIAGSGTETGGTSPAIQAFSLRAQLEQVRRNR
jgi:hypothetical protein